MGLSYHAADGEAAFYGPKLDIQIRNVFGKEDTLITIQIDFQLAQRFGMEYTDRDGSRKHPTIIHRTSIGCYERTLALVLEKFGGAMPLWIAPEQARILPIAERHLEAAEQLRARMAAQGLRVTVDARDEKIGKKIRESQGGQDSLHAGPGRQGDRERRCRAACTRGRRPGSGTSRRSHRATGP